jgi:hypothetical protein
MKNNLILENSLNILQEIKSSLNQTRPIGQKNNLPIIIE